VSNAARDKLIEVVARFGASVYETPLRLEPDDAWAYNERGVASHRMADYDRALQDYSEAVRLKPDYAEAYRNRAGAYEKKRMASAAKADRGRADELERGAHRFS
jgi:tetratricopeptide (TPR) repeat protein